MANCIRCGRQLPPIIFGKKICQWCVQHEAAQRGELADDAPQPVMAAPWVRRESSVTLTQIILGANVMIFIAMVLASGSIDEFSGRIRVSFGSNYGPLTLSGQGWRLFTYMFLHGDVMHIAFNMWCLWDLGKLCESLYGRWTFAALYVVTGVAGGVVSVGWNPYVNSVGASGAIFGLAGALIASFYLGEFSQPRIAIQSTLKSLVFFVGFNVAWGIFFSGIDNACHAGGLISGLIFGALIARIAPQHDQPLRRIGVLFFMVLVVGGSAVGVQRWRGDGIRFGSAIAAERNVDRMIGELQKRVQQSPQDASAHYALAHAYLSKEQFPEGESELKRVLDLEPTNASARMDLAATYLNQEQFSDAQGEFAKLITQKPDNAVAHAGLGMALAGQNNHEAAIQEYAAALRLEPQASGIYSRMGVSQLRLKQYDDAIASLLKDRERNDNSELETSLADAYEAKGMTQQAQDARNKAAQLRNGERD
jgi:membrane associated rhomboid family serine protease/Flp pilus assembly protein TadD